MNEREEGRPRLPGQLCLQCGVGATAMHQNQGERGCKTEGVGRDRKIESKERESKTQRKGTGKKRNQGGGKKLRRITEEWKQHTKNKTD